MLASCRFTSFTFSIFQYQIPVPIGQTISPLTHLSSEGFYHSIFVLLLVSWIIASSANSSHSLPCLCYPVEVVFVHLLSSKRLSFCLYKFLLLPTTFPYLSIAYLTPSHSSGLSSRILFLNPFCSCWLSILLVANKPLYICSLPPPPSPVTQRNKELELSSVHCYVSSN